MLPGPPAANQQFSDRLQSIIRRSSGNQPKVLVLRSGDGDAAEQAGLEEDLAIMLRVLDKAAEERMGDVPQPRSAMGIDVAFGPGSGSVRSLYLEGYGALFLLSVGFPLQRPPVAKQREEKPPADSNWEEAKRELHNQGPAYGAMGSGEEYSAERAGRLEDALIEALKNVTNIRGLKSDDMITVCVAGGGTPVRGIPAIPTRTLRTPSEPNQRVPEAISVGGGGRGPIERTTTLTLRVKKADAEAFAKGKTTAEAFRKRVSITTGTGPAFISGGVGGWSVGYGATGGFGGGGFGGAGGGGGGGAQSGEPGNR